MFIQRRNDVDSKLVIYYQVAPNDWLGAFFMKRCLNVKYLLYFCTEFVLRSKKHD